MRIALISDVHAHAVALRGVLDDIRRHRVDSLVCLGDLATLGPEPNATLELLRESRCACVAGNHDCALIEPSKAVAFGVDPSLVPALDWCASQLTRENRDFIATCKPFLRFTIAQDIDLLCYHGSPISVSDQILATTPAEEVDRMLGGQTATIMAGGHTHMQMLRQHHGMSLVNPGSVGSPFYEAFHPGIVPRALPWADYAILSTTGGVVGVELYRVPLDIDAARRALEASGLPTKDWWLKQYS